MLSFNSDELPWWYVVCVWKKQYLTRRRSWEHISANVEVFTGGRHRSCQKGRQKEEHSQRCCLRCRRIHRETLRHIWRTERPISSNVRFVPLAEITTGSLCMGFVSKMSLVFVFIMCVCSNAMHRFYYKGFVLKFITTEASHKINNCYENVAKVY